ncbi:MAG: MerR family transcriptional regulator [Erythrobacter sp.]|nr:MerR family transcriptional regulator [Erythrobacter sp.]
MAGDAPSSVRFDDGKAPDAMRTIGEVSAAFDIKQHVLRYWEAQFPMLQPLKRSGGRRLYRPADVALVERIDQLVNQQGFTLKGARKALEAGDAVASVSAPAPVAAPASAPAAPDMPLFAAAPAAPSPEVLGQLRAIRNRLAAALDA